MKLITDFKSLDEAFAYIQGLEAQLDTAATEKITLTGQLTDALKDKADAEAAAEAAIAKAESALANAPKTYEVEIPLIGTVKVNFGVDGFTKDTLLDNIEKIEALVKKGSHAVTVVKEA